MVDHPVLAEYLAKNHINEALREAAHWALVAEIQRLPKSSEPGRMRRLVSALARLRAGTRPNTRPAAR